MSEPASDSNPINLAGYQDLARQKLPRMVYDYYAGGSGDEITLGENQSAYDRLRLRYRVLRDVSELDASTTVLGQQIDLPVLIAPTAFQGLAHPEGELATARAAGAAGTIMIVSTLSNSPVEEIAKAATGPIWFQLYVYWDRGATKALVERAEAAGCSALVLTVDAQLWGQRERDARNRFRLPDELGMANLFADKESFPSGVEGSSLAAYVQSMFDPALCWQDIEWLRSITKLPLVVKGVVHPADVRLAVEHGVDGVMVSNHGGRQLDTAPATIDMLEDVVIAAEGQLEVLIDGGVQRGTAVVKALALGARAVALGRPVLWGLAVDGQAGVERVLSLLRHEFETAMGLCGAASVLDLSRDLVV